MKRLNKFIDNLLHVILSRNKTFIVICLLTLTGFIFRVIAAMNQGVLADDMHFAPGAINFLSSGKLIYWDQSSGLWFLLTDIFFKIFGVTQLASRFSAVLFGTFLIPLIFLFTRELLKKNKPAIFAAALTAFSPFAMKSMMAEMDITAMFFAIFSMFLFIRALNNNYSKNLLILSGLLMGLAIYTKVYPLLFLPGMICYLFYIMKKENNFNWGYFIKLILWILIPAFIFCIPALVHNYLLYKDKGLMDHQFTRMFGTEEAKKQYSWVAGNEAKFNPIKLFLPIQGTPENLPALLWMAKWFLILDPLVFVFGILGFIALRKQKKIGIFVLFSCFFLILYMGTIMNLQKHYVFLSLLFAPAAGFFISKINDRIPKLRIQYIIILILIFSFFYIGLGFIGSNIYVKSEIQKLMEYKQDAISKNSLVIVDSRVYRGPITWIFNDRHYLEANYFESLNAFNSSRRIPIEVYYVECAVDDCGWGTVKDQPEFNQSMEELSEKFRNISKSSKIIFSKVDSKAYYPIFVKLQETPYYIVYKTTLNLPQESLALADSTHIWWMYPLGYDEKIIPIFDKYQTKSYIDRSLDNFAHLIKTSSIFLAFLSLLLLIYFLINEIRLLEDSKSDIFMSDKVVNENNTCNDNS